VAANQGSQLSGCIYQLIVLELHTKFRRNCHKWRCFFALEKKALVGGSQLGELLIRVHLSM